MAYQYVCFRVPLSLASSFSNPSLIEEEAVAGLFRLGTFGEALWGITFSPYRGIFWYMPFNLTLFTFPFCRRAIYRDYRFWMCVSVIGLFILANASFNGWHGGGVMGPRYQVCALPFYGLFAALQVHYWPRRSRLRRALVVFFVSAVIISMSNMHVIASVSPNGGVLTPNLPKRQKMFWSNPLKYWYKSFWLGWLQPFEFNRVRLPVDPKADHRYSNFIVGEFIGLRGKWQVLPGLVLIAAAGTWVFLQTGKGKSDGSHRNGSSGLMSRPDSPSSVSPAVADD